MSGCPLQRISLSPGCPRALRRSPLAAWLRRGVVGLELFNTKSGVTEVVPRLAEVEADVQNLVEMHTECTAADLCRR